VFDAPLLVEPEPFRTRPEQPGAPDEAEQEFEMVAYRRDIERARAILTRPWSETMGHYQ